MSKKVRIASIVLVVVLFWVVVGYVFPGESSQSGSSPASIDKGAQYLPKVRIQDSKAVIRSKTINLIGITKASREVEVKAEISGKVDKILAEEGKEIKKDEVILIIEKRNRQARLDELEARYEQKKITYESSKKLSASGLQSKARVAQAKSELEAARAELIQAEIDYGNTVVKSPFTGILEEIYVEVGDYLQVGFGGGGSGSDFTNGKDVAKVIDDKPYIVEAGVSERIISQIKEDAEATVNLVNGVTAKGVVTYISKIANPETRSFKVEVTVDDDRGAPSGLTASIEMVVGEELAHKVPSSTLALDPDGRFGIKYLEKISEDESGAKGVVRFHPITVYDSDPDGVWITGLDENIDLITLGGAFVEIGMKAKGIYKDSNSDG